MCEYHNFIDYPTQLKSPEWQAKRNIILKRDQHRCQLCGKGKSNWTKILGKFYNLGIDYSYSAIQESDIIETSFSIEEFKTLLHCNQINICLYDSAYIFAINDKGIIGIMDASLKTVIENPDIKGGIHINFVKHQSGMLFYLLTSVDNKCNNLKIAMPYIRKEPLFLNVHHKHYILQRKAWEYKDNDLITLCSECHEKIHRVIGVKVFSDENGYMEEVLLTPCLRCQGTGYFPEYRHVENGVCFRCRGARFEELIQHKKLDCHPPMQDIPEDSLPF